MEPIITGTNLVFSIGSLIVGIVSTLLAFYLRLLPANAKIRGDQFSEVIGEYKLLVNSHQTQIDQLYKDVWRLKEENAKLRAARESDAIRLSELQAQLEYLQLRDPKVTPVNPSATITADDNGIIIDWDAAATVMFGWNRSDALGKPVTILMPDRVIGMHQASFERMKAYGKKPKHGIIYGTARNKFGAEFNVAIVLSGWNLDGKPVITATIRLEEDPSKKKEGSADNAHS